MQLLADWIMNQTVIDTCSQPGEAGGAVGDQSLAPLLTCQGLGAQPAPRGSSCLSFPPCGASHIQWARGLLRPVRGHAYAGVCPCVSSGRHKHISRAIKGRKGPWRLLSMTCSRAGFLPCSAGSGVELDPQTGMAGCSPVFPSQACGIPTDQGSRSDQGLQCGVSLCWHCSALLLIFEGQWGLGYGFQCSHTS